MDVTSELTSTIALQLQRHAGIDVLLLAIPETSSKNATIAATACHIKFLTATRHDERVTVVPQQRSATAHGTT